jgi:hypothetical protein
MMNKNKNFKLGVTMLSIAGIFPFIVGSFNYYRLMSNITLEHWLSIFQGRPYSNGGLPGMSDGVYSLAHMGFTNLMATGATISCVSYFSIRKGQPWGWFLLLFLCLWVGMNDLLLTSWQYFRNMKAIQFFPIPIFPVIFASTGLFLTWGTIHENLRNKRK